jgi:subtilase family serine protease
MRIVKSLVPALLLASLFSNLSYAVSPDRISGAIDPTNKVVLKGHVSPMARPQFDEGRVESSRIMRVTMLFLPSAQQQAALVKLIAQQQDETSPNYHQWITSEQFGQRFGLSQADIGKVSAWLLAQGFKITYVAHGKDYLSFEGDAGQVERAFQTEFHNFNVNGKMHFANVTAPAIPAALNGIVGGFRGLHDFTPHPRIKQHPAYSVPVTGGFGTVLAPGDLATIYDIKPLYTAHVDGTGQSVVIAGQTDVYIADLNFFRSAFGLTSISGCTLDSTQTILHAGACSAGNFKVVWPGGDPGLSSGDIGESDLDIETMSGIVPGAEIIFVSSLASTGGVDTSASYAIDQQLAPVISYSYGLCEAFVTAPGIAASEIEFKKANALGISFFAASGDAAAATCDGDNNGTFPAILGPSVSYPASSPEVTAVGGTEFNEGSGTYWSSTNTNNASALSYIPELAWNDTASLGVLDGTGGGPSNCAFGTGLTSVSGFEFELCKAPPNGGFPKPTWQTGGVTLSDSVRDVPDISFSASNQNDPFIVCTPQSQIQGDPNVSTSSCVSGINTAILTFNSLFGGTSASTPVTAGMAVLLNQYLGASGLGNINPELYKLYSSNPAVFHDITTGTSGFTGDTSDNIVTCNGATPSFEPSALQCPGATGTANTFGFSVQGGHKYSAATGLGSVDVNALFTAWAASSARTASSVALSPSATNVQAGTSVTFTATVTPSTGVGSVQFSTVNNSTTTVLGTVLLNLPSAATGTAVLTTTALPGGSNSVTAKYEGDGTNKASTSTAVTVTVTAPDFSILAAPTTTTVIAGHNSANITLTFTPINGMNQPITPSCTGMPTGATCAFNPPPPVTMDGTNPKSTVMTISTAANVAAATTGITISATGSGVTHTITPFNLTTAATDQTFTLTDPTTSFSVKQGSSVNTTITVTPGATGFSTPVTFTCTGAPSEATCTVSPTSSATSTTLTFTTTAPSAQLQLPFGRGTRIFYAALLPGLLGIMFTVGSRRRSLRGLRLLGMICVLSFSTLWLGSCTGSNSGTKNAGTPPGTYPLTVSATTTTATGSGTPITNSNAFTLSLTVTP